MKHHLNWAAYQILKPVLKSFTRIALDLDVDKRQYQKIQGPKIYVANHPTSIDPFYLASEIADPAHILIIHHVFDLPVLGKFLHRTGHIPVFRDHGQVAIDQAIDYLREGKSVMIFPEGHISPQEGGYCRPHTGAVRIALESGAPIIPVGIHVNRAAIKRFPIETENGTEFGHSYFRGTYAMTFGDPILLNGNVTDFDHVKALTYDVMENIIELAHQSAVRVEAQKRRGILTRVQSFTNAALLLGRKVLNGFWFEPPMA